jgi:hypothetical protein
MVKIGIAARICMSVAATATVSVGLHVTVASAFLVAPSHTIRTARSQLSVSTSSQQQDQDQSTTSDAASSAEWIQKDFNEFTPAPAVARAPLNRVVIGPKEVLVYDTTLRGESSYLALSRRDSFSISNGILFQVDSKACQNQDGKSFEHAVEVHSTLILICLSVDLT